MYTKNKKKTKKHQPDLFNQETLSTLSSFAKSLQNKSTGNKNILIEAYNNYPIPVETPLSDYFNSCDNPTPYILKRQNHYDKSI